MNNNIFLHLPGNSHHLAMHFGHPDTTIITGEAYISQEPTGERLGLLAPDLLIAFNVNPAASAARNGYVISEQGKPPDFLLEIASASTGRRDVTVKREGYAALGIPEYWRLDDSGGRYHGVPLAGDRLVEGAYQAIPIEMIDRGTHQGYSTALNLYLRWEQGRLGWYDPAPVSTSPGSATSGPGPTGPKPVLRPPRPASVSWRTNSAAASKPDCCPAFRRPAKDKVPMIVSPGWPLRR
jgi:hypothetical protein